MKISGDTLKGFGCMVVILFWVPFVAGATSHDLHVVPNMIQIGAFFHGVELEVIGKIPEGADAIIEVRGDKREEKLMRKGHRGGLWMNVGEVQIQGAPCLYIVMSTDPALLSSPEADPQWGYRVLQKQVIFSGQLQEGELPELLGEFIRLKESEGLYGIFPGSLKVSHSSEKGRSIHGTFWLPAKVTPGTYSVCLSVIQNGRLLKRECTPFQVVMVGFPAFLSSLARHHGALYGILAVIIAIVTGFLMGLLFKGKGGH